MRRKPPRRPAARASINSITTAAATLTSVCKRRKTGASAWCKDRSCGTGNSARRSWSTRRKPTRHFEALVAGDRETRRKLRKSVRLAFRSYQPLLANHFNGKRVKSVEVDRTGTPEKLREDLLEKLEAAREAVDQAHKLPISKFFRFVPLWFLATLIAGAHLWLALRPGGAGLEAVLPSLAIAEGVLLAFWVLGYVLLLGTIRRASESLAAARILEIRAEKASIKHLAAMDAAMQAEHTAEVQSLGVTFRESDEDWKTRMSEGQKKLERQLARIPARLEKLQRRKIAKIDAAHERALEAAQAGSRRTRAPH